VKVSESKTVLVTGAASGIGLATAKRFAAKRHTVILLDRNEAVHEMASEARKEGAKVLAVVADLAEFGDIQKACKAVDDWSGGCDILVNNAGVHPKRDGNVISFEELTITDWETVFRINSTAPFLLCQHFLPGMKRKGWGRIINVASRAARTYSERAAAHYTASKHALLGVTRYIGGAYASSGITANCVTPGQIDTALARLHSAESLKKAALSTPVGRLGTANEVAAAIEYLASDDAGFVTGSVLDVNGGAFIG
jgi:3-oxoacyl-[acyl-carrier protein] reductase